MTATASSRPGPQIAPAAALLIALAKIVFWSFVFNAGVRLGLGRVLGPFASAVPLVAFLFLAIAIANAADECRRRRGLVIFAAGAIASLAYLAALLAGARFVTDWLFPRWPGEPPNFSAGSVALVLLCAAATGGLSYLLGSTSLLRRRLTPEEKTAATRDLVKEAGGAVGDQARGEERTKPDLDPD